MEEVLNVDNPSLLVCFVVSIGSVYRTAGRNFPGNLNLSNDNFKCRMLHVYENVL